MNIIETLEYYKKDCLRLRLFSEFMNYTYSPDDISCFLLIRSLIEREIGVKIVSIDKKQILDLTKVALSRKQAKKVFQQFMVDEPGILVEKSFQRFFSANLRMNNSEMIHPYEMMIHGVKEYKQLAEKKLASNLKSNNFSTNSYIDCCFMTTLNANNQKRQSIFDSESTPLQPALDNLKENQMTWRGDTGQNNWTCGVNFSNPVFNCQSNNTDKNVPVEIAQTGQFPSNGYFMTQNKENVSPGLAVFKVGAQISSGKNHDSKKENSQDVFKNDYGEPSTNRFVNFAHQTFKPMDTAEYSNLHKTSRDELDTKQPHMESAFDLDQHKVSVESMANDKNYNTVLNLSDQCFQTLKQIINIFVTDVMSEEALEEGAEEAVVEEISGIIYHKSKLLLKAITRKDKAKWFDQLMIKRANREQIHYLDVIITTFDKLLHEYRAKGVADERKVQEIGKMILKAPEMTSQIGKLIAHIVSTLEETDAKIEQTLDSSIKKNGKFIEKKQEEQRFKQEKNKKMDALVAHLQEDPEELAFHSLSQIPGMSQQPDDQLETSHQSEDDNFTSFKNKFNPTSIINEDGDEDVEEEAYEYPTNKGHSTGTGFVSGISEPEFPGHALQARHFNDMLINPEIEEADGYANHQDYY